MAVFPLIYIFASFKLSIIRITLIMGKKTLSFKLKHIIYFYDLFKFLSAGKGNKGIQFGKAVLTRGLIRKYAWKCQEALSFDGPMKYRRAGMESGGRG